MKILITDDSKFMRVKLTEICKEFSAAVVIEEAGTGLESINKCASFSPDIVFMDITMPQMDGVEATKSIKERWPKIKVIICSAIAETQRAKEGIAFGADELIAKPFAKDQIIQVLSRLSKTIA